MFLFVCISVTALLLLLVLDMVKPKNYPPGPNFLPIIGTYWYYKNKLKALGYHHLVLTELSKEYGDIVGLKLGRHLVVAVFGADAIKEVLTREEFDGRPDGFFFRLRTFGKRLGIVFSDGQFWKKQRKFSFQHLRHFGLGRKEMEEKIQEETRCLMDVFKSQCSEPIFMHTAFDVSVLNVLWAMIAGRRFDIEDKRLRELLQIIHDAFRLVDMSGGLINQMPFLRHIAPNACGYNKIMNILNRMWTFLEETISEHRKTICLSQPRDLIDTFLQKNEYDQLISLCLDLFMAGAETTSNTLAFTVMHMALHPEVQKNVQKELDAEVGRNRWPNLNDRINLKYTEAVIMEIQRRNNIAPVGIAHRVTKNTELLGYSIPEGTIVLTSLYSVHMDNNFWKDPLEFRPERFLDEHGDITVNEKYFLPFGQGKRRCLGESLAKVNLFLFFTALLHNFSVEADPDFYPQLEGYDGVTIAPKPFRVKLIPREE
ncbi:hypothetical protein NQ315_004221 [Exocentrus adspersus]|uniref:Cytochrome P450 n=1 Tax=Exocentrus adspersus TaxID=1586481 RepID=A0AAV8W841_9CUCU|nr:hypothetical protein NQ315_004221 [Exocentrus adspersus]